jgi:hypothetical protein
LEYALVFPVIVSDNSLHGTGKLKVTFPVFVFKLMGCTDSVSLLQYPLFPNAE